MTFKLAIWKIKSNRNDVRMQRHDPAARIAPELLNKFFRPKRAWGTPGVRHTRSLVRKVV
jgi:hypothetical protein